MIIPPFLELPGLFIVGYLCGSIPFAIWITYLARGVDVRLAGSGHATATNTFRQAGWGAGAAVFILDVAKGYIPVWLALHYGAGPWPAVIAGAGAVIGHCWPLLAQFRGGMGLATASGAMLAVSPLAWLLGIGTLVAWVLGLHHAARGSIFAAVTLPVILWLVGVRGTDLGLSAAVCLILAVRFLVDWNRKYRELWLDRQKS